MAFSSHLFKISSAHSIMTKKQSNREQKETEVIHHLICDVHMNFQLIVYFSVNVFLFFSFFFQFGNMFHVICCAKKNKLNNKTRTQYRKSWIDSISSLGFWFRATTIKPLIRRLRNNFPEVRTNTRQLNKTKHKWHAYQQTIVDTNTKYLSFAIFFSFFLLVLFCSCFTRKSNEIIKSEIAIAATTTTNRNVAAKQNTHLIIYYVYMLMPQFTVCVIFNVYWKIFFSPFLVLVDMFLLFLAFWN